MGKRARFRFVGRVEDHLVWERPLSGDSRVEQITAPAGWFYGMMRPTQQLEGGERRG